MWAVGAVWVERVLAVGWGKKGKRKWATTNVVFMTYCLGLALHGSPFMSLIFLPPSFLHRLLHSIHCCWVLHHWPGLPLTVVSLHSPSLGSACCCWWTCHHHHWAAMSLLGTHCCVVAVFCLGGVHVFKSSDHCCPGGGLTAHSQGALSIFFFQNLDQTSLEYL